MASDRTQTTQGGTLADQKKTFGLFSTVLFGVSAIVVADTVGASAAIGVQGLGFWIVLGLLEDDVLGDHRRRDGDLAARRLVALPPQPPEGVASGAARTDRAATTSAVNEGAH